MLATDPTSRSGVGPAASTNTSSSRARSSRLAWLRRLTPLSNPATTDASAMDVMPAMISTLVVSVSGTPNRWANPAAVCSAPRPSEVASPKSGEHGEDVDEMAEPAPHSLAEDGIERQPQRQRQPEVEAAKASATATTANIAHGCTPQ